MHIARIAAIHDLSMKSCYNSNAAYLVLLRMLIRLQYGDTFSTRYVCRSIGLGHVIVDESTVYRVIMDKLRRESGSDGFKNAPFLMGTTHKGFSIIREYTT
jgi:hypothetical protein